ncbi:EpsG family protein [Acinetobacter sp. ANC 4178]|uniref:EpsG family protein n=1 Tax=Acinetobacter sp. ANC 4178 TaxID=2529839 RepID=UPI00103C403B|nr:EpsG family protein [Acinetobacter sp. ANC 4178]TCB65060.1 EpsG family protein [Acinetobacter sp. ANC 4178]
MIPYLIVLFFVMFITFIESKKLSRKAIIVPSLFLILLPSLRSNNIGTDSKTYTLAYDFNYDPYRYGFDPDIEYGYQLLDSIILNFTHNYFWLFFISSLFVIPAYLLTIKKLSINYYYSILIFVTFGFYTFFFNGLRQGIAMAICFFSLPYLIEKRIISYFIIIIFAAMFHVSALVMVPIYFLVNLKIKIEYKVLVCFIFSTLISQILIGYLAKGNSRYDNYTREVDQAGGYITLLFFALIGFFVFVTGKRFRNEDVVFNRSEQILLCGLALVFPVAFLGTDPSGPQRILYYFTSMCIFLIPYVLKKYNNIFINILFVIFSIFYFLIITMRFGELYPYQINPIFEVF